MSERPSFEEVYRSSFSFVWRNVLRLGTDPSSVDDVVQEIFLVVHRKLPEFEGRAALKTWLFAIVRRVVSDHRRSRKRKPSEATDDLDHLGEHESSESKVEAFDLVNRLLEELDEEKREVFVLAELEELTMAEISEMTGVNANTVAARLRAARKVFAAAVREHDDGAAT